MTAHLDRLEPRRLCDGGSPVPTFGSGGATPVVTVPFRSNGRGETVTAQDVLADGAGRAYVVVHTQSSVQVRRLTAGGAVDGTFGNGRGILVFPVSGKLLDRRHAGATDLALDPADRLYVLLGNTITRYTAAGALDPTFGTAGTFTLTGLVGARQIAVDQSNKIWVAGSVSTGKTVGLLQFTVARVASRGKYDKSFDGDGRLTVPLPGGNNGDRSTGDYVRVMGDGSVVAAAAVDDRPVEAPPNSDTARGVQVAHFRRNGTLDRAFGTGGVVSRVVSDTADRENFLRPQAIRTDGGVVLRGTTVDGPDPGLSLVTAAGDVTAFAPSTDAGVAGTFANARFFATAGHAFAFVPDDRTVYRFDGDRFDTAFGPPGPTNGGVFPVMAAGADASTGTVLAVTASRKALSVSVERLFADGKPVATLTPRRTAAGAAAVGAAAVGFGVTYAADGGVKASTVDGDELRVVTPAGTVLRPRLKSATADAAGAVVARYTFPAAGGTADAGDAGAYAVRWLAGSVAAADGTGNRKATLGTIELDTG